MNRREKFWYFVGPVLMSFCFACTGPIVHQYFMGVVATNIIAMSRTLDTLISMVVNYSITLEKLQEWYRKHFMLIVIVDCACYIIICYVCIDLPEIRFFGMAVLDSITTTLWVMVMRNLANRIIVDGDQRTIFDALRNTWELGATLCGGFLGILVSTYCMDLEHIVEYCLFAQCVANGLMGATDLKSYNMLRDKADLAEQRA